MPTADRVLITGASGFVGSAVARAAAARGFSVRALVRASSPRANLAEMECEIVEGDMKDAASMRRAMKDVRYLFHVAADYRLWARDTTEIYRNNVEGTRAVMEAALEAGVERIVYTSSVATLKPIAGTSADETHRLNENAAVGAYKRSKVAAERLVEGMAERRGLAAVIVNPSTPIGPRDIRPTPTGRIIIEAAMGRMPAFLETGLNLVHVEDVAEGHMLALERGQIGHSYTLGGQNATLKEMLTIIAALAGRRAPWVRLPRRPLFPLAYAAEMVARMTGKEPFITADGLKMAKYRMFFDSSKAENALGYRARPYRDGIEQALIWFRQAGYLR
jgi:dihydroflavonol-4-reductase